MSLKFFDARCQFGETAVKGVLLFELFERAGRGTPDRLASADRLSAQHSRLSSNYRAVFQFTVFAESRLPSDDHIPADDTRTGKSDLRGHHRVRANLAVVANVHQVVEFHALRDARVIERTAVNRRVGANFDVIANLHNTNLRELPLPPVSQGVAESVGANHGDRKSTRLNSSHPSISYAVFCLKKKTNKASVVRTHP